jgi:hypothetical protein
MSPYTTHKVTVVVEFIVRGAHSEGAKIDETVASIAKLPGATVVSVTAEKK